jgi:hypothetical protein
MLPSPDHVLTPPATVKASDTSPKPSEAVEAALLVVALYHGRLTAAQACKLAWANPAYFAKVNAMGAREREQLSTGELKLTDFGKYTNGHNGHANGKNGRSTESLIEHMQRSTAAELAVAVKKYGTAKFFDAVIVPILDGGDTTTITIED